MKRSYKLYDRSGVDDTVEPLSFMGQTTSSAAVGTGASAAAAASDNPAEAAPSAPPAATKSSEVLVCHAGTCRARGAEAVLAEIEELVSTVPGGPESCTVRRSGCVGYCSQAPNAIVRERGGRGTVHTRIRSLEASTKVVERATGTKLSLDMNAGAGTQGGRLAELRAARVRQHAVSVYKWNAALHGLAEQAARRPSARTELATLLEAAGFPCGGIGTEMPSSISNYTQWSVEEVTPVSKHSALFRLTSTDRKRGTPHPRGRGRQPPTGITWHTTLLGEVGKNSEGPLPWIERDYTPVSSAKEWESGRCEILIKIYSDGKATSWLHEKTPSSLWLSKPVKTLHVPGLVAEGSSFRPASVLLLLAGTGVVALPQILAHRDPINMLGISTPKRSQLHVPIDLVLSCREDDVLLLPQIAQWCRDSVTNGATSGLRRCILLLTPPGNEGPFPDAPSAGVAEAEAAFQGIENACVMRSRLSPEIAAMAVGNMIQPCRYVISGPGGFNAAAQGMLSELARDEDDITVLSA